MDTGRSLLTDAVAGQHDHVVYLFGHMGALRGGYCDDRCVDKQENGAEIKGEGVGEQARFLFSPALVISGEEEEEEEEEDDANCRLVWPARSGRIK